MKKIYTTPILYRKHLLKGGCFFGGAPSMEVIYLEGVVTFRASFAPFRETSQGFGI